VAALMGLGLTQWASHEVGRLTFRARPFVAMHFTPLFPHAPNNSFPSSLTAFAAVAAVIGVLAWRRRGWVLVLGTVVVAIGCVYVGVHYVSDVIAGAALGAAGGGVTWLVSGLPPVARLLRGAERRLPRRRPPALRLPMSLQGRQVAGQVHGDQTQQIASGRSRRGGCADVGDRAETGSPLVDVRQAPPGTGQRGQPEPTPHETGGQAIPRRRLVKRSVAAVTALRGQFQTDPLPSGP
jgi:hypothetical protein